MRCCLTILILACPGAQARAQITLPAVINAKPGRLVKIEAQTTLKKLTWIKPTEDCDFFSLPADNSALFLGPTAGSYRVLCLGAKGDEAYWAECLVNVGGPAPPVPPGPGPVPPIPPAPVSKLGILVVKDANTETAEQIRILAEAKRVLEGKGHQVWVRYSSSAALADRGYAPWITKAGGAPAVVFLDPAGKVRSAHKLPEGVDALLDLVKQAGGLTDPTIKTDERGIQYIEAAGARRYLTSIVSPLEKRRTFRTYADVLGVIPEASWKEWTMTEVAKPRILDQDSRGACVGHGAIGAFELMWRFNLRGKQEFCPWVLYAQICGGVDEGAIVSDALEAMQKRGCAPWGIMPYSEFRERAIPARALEEAKRFHPDAVYWTKTWEEIGTAAYRGHPVVFGCETGSRFNPDRNGVLPDLSGRGGGHCMFVAGIKKVNGVWHMHVINSWSTEWGVNGECWMPRSYFKTADIADAFALVSPGEDPQDTHPLPRVSARARDNRLASYFQCP